MITTEIKISDLTFPKWNARKIKEEGLQKLCESIKNDPEFLQARPVIASNRTGRLMVVAGNMRVRAAQFLKMKTIPTIVVALTEKKEKEWSLKDNLHQGTWDWDLLADFGESFLKDAGFGSEELDEVFGVDERPEEFNLANELKKLQIEKIEVQKGDLWQLGDHYLYCGDSTMDADVISLMRDQKANMVMTDPPYRLEYLKGKSRNGISTTGFGMKKNRRYLETESLPENFTRLWMDNVAKVQADDFSIICYENWKNLREVWGEMERHWKVRNMIIWALPNRNQGYAPKLKFFSKHDIAMLGTSDGKELNLKNEVELLQNEYEAALFAVSGSPHWEGYGKGKRFCPTDHITFNAADEKSSGQGVIFGIKPTEILIPYIKVLTKRGDIVFEPFGGSGSTLVSCEKLKRRCFLMEKVPTYAQIIIRRWEKLTSRKAVKIHG